MTHPALLAPQLAQAFALNGPTASIQRPQRHRERLHGGAVGHWQRQRQLCCGHGAHLLALVSHAETQAAHRPGRT